MCEIAHFDFSLLKYGLHPLSTSNCPYAPQHQTAPQVFGTAPAAGWKQRSQQDFLGQVPSVAGAGKPSGSVRILLDSDCDLISSLPLENIDEEILQWTLSCLFGHLRKRLGDVWWYSAVERHMYYQIHTCFLAATCDCSHPIESSDCHEKTQNTTAMLCCWHLILEL